MANPAELKLNQQYDDAIRRLREFTLQQAQASNQYGADLTAQQQGLAAPLMVDSQRAAQDVQGAYGSTSGAYRGALAKLQQQLALYGGAKPGVQAQAQQDLGQFAAQRDSQSVYQQQLQKLAAQQFAADKAAGGQLAHDSAAYLGNQFAIGENDLNVKRLDDLKQMREAAAAGGGYGGGGGGRSGSRGGGRGGSRSSGYYTSYADADAQINAAADAAEQYQRYIRSPQYQLITYNMPGRYNAQGVYEQQKLPVGYKGPRRATVR